MIKDTPENIEVLRKVFTQVLEQGV